MTCTTLYLLITIKRIRGISMSDEDLPASVQFHDNLEQITQMKNRRFSYRRIWQQLHDSGDYTGHYTHFCRLAKAEFGENSNKPKVFKNPKKEIDRQDQEKVEPEAINDEDDDEGPLLYMNDLNSSVKKNT